MGVYIAAALEALKLIPVAAKEIAIAKAEGERLSGAKLVAAMHARYAEARADEGLPPGVRGGP